MADFEEAQPFLGDFGISFQVGAKVAKGILDSPGQVIELGGVNVMATDYTLTFATEEVAELKDGVTVTLLTGRVTGSFRARDVKLVDDGIFSQAKLKVHG